MKSYLILTTICFLVATVVISSNALEIPEHLKKHAKRLHKRCQNQTDTPEDVIKEALKGTLPKNKNFECYIQCLFDIMGLMDENNLIHLENLTQVLPEEIHPMIIKLSEACGTKEGDDKCNIAFSTLQCYIDTNPIMITDNFEFLFD